MIKKYFFNEISENDFYDDVYVELFENAKLFYEKKFAIIYSNSYESIKPIIENIIKQFVNSFDL